MSIAYEVLSHINEPFICSINGEEREYENGEIVHDSISRKYAVQGKNLFYELDNVFSRDGKIAVSLTKWFHTPGTADLDALWVKRYEKKHGRLPDLFYGN